jgi:hypothetical protein
MYLKCKNDKVIKIYKSIAELLEDHPNVNFFRFTQKPAEDLLREYDIYPLITTDRPHGNVIIEGEPQLGEDGKWYQTWHARSYTAKERKEIFVSKEEIIKRKSICDTCEAYNKILKTCGECGCFMPIKRKFKGLGCPLEKW